MYEPSPLAKQDLDALAQYVEEELRRVGVALQQISDILLEERHEEPSKPRNGLLAYADGTDWNPGSGRGVYLYDSNGPTWRFLG